MLAPFLRYRPTRTSDGQGGFAETNGQPRTLFGALSFPKSLPRMTVRANSDIEVTDLVKVKGEEYRVTHVERQNQAEHKILLLEKLDKPIG